MVENLENINLINRKFEFVGYSKDKIIYKNIDSELNEMRILEIGISKEENKINKIDIYTIEDEEGVESLHIKRGIDKITEIDYYSVYDKVITIDGKKDFYRMNAYIVYNEDNEKYYQEHCKLELIKKGHKRCKTLTELPLANNLFITSDNRFHHVSSVNLSELKNLTKSITMNIKQIEETIFMNKQTKVVKEDVSQDERIEEVIEKYPISLFVYDRGYDLIGLKNKALVYRNTEEDIIEIEIYFNENEESIKEVRFVYYKDIEIEGIKNKSKKKIIRLIKTEDERIKASLCNRSKETIRMNDFSIDKIIIKADALISDNGKIEEIGVKLENSIRKFDLKKTYSFGNYFIDQDNNEYTLSSHSYLTFKALISFAPGIIRNLEKKLISQPNQEKNEKKLLMKK